MLKAQNSYMMNLLVATFFPRQQLKTTGKKIHNSCKQNELFKWLMLVVKTE